MIEVGQKYKVLDAYSACINDNYLNGDIFEVSRVVGGVGINDATGKAINTYDIDNKRLSLIESQDEQDVTTPRKVFEVRASVSDGSTASYYKLPVGATELQHLISAKNMNSQIGEIFRSTYRYGQASHSDQLRDAKKIKFYIEQEIARIEQELAGGWEYAE